MSAARGLEWPIITISSFNVTLGSRALTVAAWCLRSWACTPVTPTATQAARHAVDKSDRRSGSPDALVNTQASGSAPTNAAK
ncbi:MAG: hypothetical protein ABSD78_09570 [Acidimicrobiales bacterium]